MAVTGQTHLSVFFALRERGELQLHVLHGPGPGLVGGVGVGVIRPARPSGCQWQRKEGGRVDRRTDGRAAGLQLTHAD